MKGERMLILTMLQEGKINSEEAAALLQALGGSRDGDAPGDGGGGDVDGGPAGGAGRRAGAPGRDGGLHVDLGAAWDDAMHFVGKARAKVESALERTRRRMDEAGRRARDAGERAKEAGERALHVGDEAVEDAGDFFADVERGLAKVAAELPAAVSRLARLEFGPGGRHEIPWRCEGTFDEGAEVVTVQVFAGDGRVRVEGTDEDAYRVDVLHKVRAADPEEAALVAKEATSWEATGDGLRLAVGHSRDVRSHVVLRLPRRRQYALEVQAADGAVAIQDVHGTDVAVNTADGGVRLARVRAAAVHATTADGGIRIEDVIAERVTTSSANGGVRVSGDVAVLSATSADGSVQATYAAAHDGSGAEEDGEAAGAAKGAAKKIAWDVRTSDGGVRLHLPVGEQIGYDLDLASADGSVRVRLPDAEATGTGTDRRGVHIVTPDFGSKALQFTVRARTADGSVSVRSGSEEAD